MAGLLQTSELNLNSRKDAIKVAKKFTIAVGPASMSRCVSRIRIKGPNPEERLRL